MEQQIIDYKFIDKSGAVSGDCPIYINVPLRDIKPTKEPVGHYDSTALHPVKRRWVRPKSQPFRLWINTDGDIFLGEGSRMIHYDITAALGQSGFSKEQIGSWQDGGYIQMFEDVIYIVLRSKHCTCLEKVQEWASGTNHLISHEPF